MSMVSLDPWLCGNLIESARADVEVHHGTEVHDGVQLIETMRMLADQLEAALREVRLLDGTMDAEIARLTAAGSFVEVAHASVLRDEARELHKKRMIERGAS